MRQALRLKPDYPKVVLRKARLHARLKEWDLAIEVRHAVGVTSSGMSLVRGRQEFGVRSCEVHVCLFCTRCRPVVAVAVCHGDKHMLPFHQGNTNTTSVGAVAPPPSSDGRLDWRTVVFQQGSKRRTARLFSLVVLLKGAKNSTRGMKQMCSEAGIQQRSTPRKHR